MHGATGWYRTMTGPSSFLKTIHHSLRLLALVGVAPRSPERLKCRQQQLEGPLRPSASITSRNWNLSYMSTASVSHVRTTIGFIVAWRSHLQLVLRANQQRSRRPRRRSSWCNGDYFVTWPLPLLLSISCLPSVIVAFCYRGIRYSWNLWPQW